MNTGSMDSGRIKQGSDSDFFNLMNNLLRVTSDGSSSEITRCVRSGLTNASHLFGVDEVFLFKIEKPSTASTDILFSQFGLSEKIEDQIKMEELPWIQGKILSSQEVKLVDINEIREAAKVDFNILSNAGIRSILIEPLFGGGRQVNGFIGLLSINQKHSWAHEEVLRLKFMGEVVGNAFERMEIETGREEKDDFHVALNQFVEAALENDDYYDALEALSKNMNFIASSDVCGFGVWNDEERVVYPVGIYGARENEIDGLKLEYGDKTLTEFSLNYGDTLVIEDVAHSKFKNYKVVESFPVSSIMVLPLRNNTQKLGSVFIGYRNPHVFTREQIKRCKQAARQISLVLGKIQLIENNRRYIEKINTISKFSAAMRNAQTLAEIPAMIMDKVIDLCEVDDVALIFINPTKNSPSIFLNGKDWQEFHQDEFSRKYPFVEKVISSGRTIQIPTKEESITRLVQGIVGNYLIAFPMIAHQQSLGVFCVKSHTPYTDKRINLLKAVVELVANAAYRQSLVDSLHVQLETLRSTRKQLVQREKLAAIGELIAGVAHELNNPLTTIELTSEMLYQQATNEQDRHDLVKIIAESHRAAKIVHSLLDFSRQHVPERKIVNINELLLNTVDLVNYELVQNEITCELRLDDMIPATIADPYQIKQVLINIVTNAIQALKEVDHARKIEIVSETGPSRFYGQAIDDSEFICLTIADNGSGISPSVLPKIFDPFFTTKAEGQGTGLGLSVCHGIIMEHGGHIWAESRVDGGTQMYIELPIQQQTAAELESITTDPEIPVESLRLLIVDDEVNVLEILRRSLVNRGYSVDTAENGLEGLAKVAAISYDLIICDVSMPGMGGIKFHQEIRTRNKEFIGKIIFTSGDVINEKTEEFIKNARCALLQKPFELDDLLKIISEQIDETKKD